MTITVYDTPLPTDGVNTGNGTDRIIVRLATAGSAGLLGTFILGTDLLGDVIWTDVTNYVQGGTITRGCEAFGRPGAGVLTLMLNNQSGIFASRLSLYNGPGSYIQVVMTSGGSVYPLFTGITKAWNESSDAKNALKMVQIEAYEPIALLTEVDNVALSSPVGDGEFYPARLARLLTAANWSGNYDYASVAPMSGWALQSTLMTQDTYTELCNLADSLTLVVRSSTYGEVFFGPRTSSVNTYILNSTGTYGVPVVADSIETTNNDDWIISHVAVSRTGGTQTTYSSSFVQGFYQYRSSQRTDLITKDPGSDLDLSTYATDYLTRRAQPYRVERVSVDTGHGTAVWSFLMNLEIGTAVNVSDTYRGVGFTGYVVSGYTMDISPLTKRSVHITATLETEPTVTSDWSVI